MWVAVAGSGCAQALEAEVVSEASGDANGASYSLNFCNFCSDAHALEAEMTETFVSDRGYVVKVLDAVAVGSTVPAYPCVHNV